MSLKYDAEVSDFEWRLSIEDYNLCICADWVACEFVLITLQFPELQVPPRYLKVKPKASFGGGKQKDEPVVFGPLLFSDYFAGLLDQVFLWYYSICTLLTLLVAFFICLLFWLPSLLFFSFSRPLPFFSILGKIFIKFAQTTSFSSSRFQLNFLFFCFFSGNYFILLASL